MSEYDGESHDPGECEGCGDTEGIRVLAVMRGDGSWHHLDRPYRVRLEDGLCQYCRAKAKREAK